MMMRHIATRLQLWSCVGPWLGAFRISASGVRLGWFAAEDHAVWFFRERFHKRLGVRRDNFQIQERHVQLFQLFLERLIRRADEMVRRSNAVSACWTGN